MDSRILFVLAALTVAAQAGVIAQSIVAAPLPYAVAPYASSYTAHVAHHAVATPVAAAPYVSAVAASPYVAASAPIVTSSGVVTPYLAPAVFAGK